MKKISFLKIAFSLPIFIFFLLGSVVFANQLWKTPESVTAANDFLVKDMGLLAAANAPPLNCVAGYENWKKSQTYKVHPQWNIDFMGDNISGTINSEKYFSDINGDGLSDYIHIKSISGNNPYIERCVYLNNGASGWNPVYRCYGKGLFSPGDPWTFYGDCAE